jgi:hypothetical protein
VANPQVSDIKDSLHIWKMDTNMLNQQPWIANIGWSLVWRNRRKANNPSPWKFRLLGAEATLERDIFFGTSKQDS